MADAPKLPRRPGQSASSSQRPAPARPNLRPSGRTVKPASPAPAPSSDEALLDDEPLLEDGDVPMRNGPRNIADDVEEEPAPVPVRPKPASVRAAPQAAPAPTKPSVSGRAPAAKPEAKPVAKTSSRIAPPPVKPPVAQSVDAEEEDIDFDSEDPEATKEMPAPKSKKKGSAREEAHQSGRRVLSARQKPEPDDDAEEEEETPRTSKRSSAKRSGQMKAVGGKGIPKLYLIGAGVAVIAILVVAIGYKPFMLGQYEKAITTGATIDERKAGAEKLVDSYTDESYGILKKLSDEPDEQTREAVIHGIGLYGVADASPKTTATERRSEAISLLSNALSSAKGNAKKQTVAALKPIAEKVVNASEKPADGKASPQEEQMKELAKALIPLTEPVGDGDLELRREAIGVLAQLRTPGVCKQMIKLASSDAQVKDAARAAIPTTVLPDAAGDLLRAMKSEDKALAEAAKRAFVGVRDSAPSKDLLPLVGDPSPDVRKEIVEALGKRASDSIAQQGIAKALKDSEANIRLLAVKAVPVTNLTSYAPVGELSKDSDEAVRVASGETLGKLRDAESYTVLLDAFKNSLDGKTLDAYVKALGARARGKDMKNIGLVIGLLDTNPASDASLREALVLLSNNGVGPQRDRIRKAWTAAQWKQWYAKFNEREKLREEANAVVKVASAKRNADRDTFAAIKNDIEKAMEKLEKAQAMCQPDDAEDAKDFDKEMKAASVAKEYFIKGASFNLR